MENNRRGFIKQMGGILAGLGLSPLALAVDPPRAGAGLLGACDYWESVRGQYFSLNQGLVYVNNSTLGPTLAPVQLRMREVQELFAGGLSLNDFVLKVIMALSPIRAKFEELAGVWPGGRFGGRYVSMVSSVTEGMSLAANGLTLGPGDTILTTDHEHTGGFTMWELQKDRYGAGLVEVPLLVEGQTEEQWADGLVERFRTALEQNPVKVMSFSYLTTSTGHILPVKRLCALAREYGAISVVDAAQAFAVLPIDAQDLDFDFMVMNGHKYLCGPPGSGFVCINPRQADDPGSFWGTIVDDNYYYPDDPQRNYPWRSGGMKAFTNVLPLYQALEFYETLGIQNVFERLAHLGRWMRTGLSRYPDQFELITPSGPGLSCSMTCFRYSSGSEQMVDALYEQYGIQAKHSTEGGADAVRLAPHYYNTEKELLGLARAICAIAGVDAALWLEGNPVCVEPR